MEFEKVRQVIADILSLPEDEITMEKEFVDDLGADSLDIFQIAIGLEEEFGIEITNEEIDEIVTVADAVEKIKTAFN